MSYFDAYEKYDVGYIGTFWLTTGIVEDRDVHNKIIYHSSDFRDIINNFIPEDKKGIIVRIRSSVTHSGDNLLYDEFRQLKSKISYKVIAYGAKTGLYNKWCFPKNPKLDCELEALFNEIITN